MAATKSNPITFYDVSSLLNPPSWSPNTWKVRLVLNYKGLPYKTKFIQYVEIDPILRALGFPPTAGPRATVPSISDPSPAGGPPILKTPSLEVVEYLDSTYPQKPVFPGASKALQLFLIDHIENNVFPTLVPVVLTLVPDILEEQNANFIRRREDWAAAFGDYVENIRPAPGAPIEAQWAKAEAAFGSLAAIYEKNDGKYPFILGKEPVYADFFLDAILIWIKKVGTSNDDGAPWDRVRKWHGGRWERFTNSLKQYEAVV